MSFVMIEVPEAIVTDDGRDLQFKVVSHTEEGPSATMLRTHAQIVFFDSRLTAAFKNFILPSLPDGPNPGMVNEADHVEKKRRQIQRYLNKLLEREEIAQHEDFKKFLTVPVASSGVIADSFSVATQLASSMASGMFISLTNKADSGIKIYKPTQMIDDVDETDFEKRKMHILQAERDHRLILDTIASKLRVRNGLGRSFLALGQALSELDTSPQSLGGKIFHFNEFGIKMNGLIHEQFKDDVFHFGDVVLEYRNNANMKVMEIDLQTKNLTRSNELVEKAKKKSEVSAEFMAASEDRNQAKDKVDGLQKDYDQFKKSMVQEFDRFESKKQTDFKEALDHYVKVQINLESKKLEALTHLLRQLTS